MSEAALARRIEMTGWSTLVLGVACVGVSVLQAILPLVLTRLAASLGEADDGLQSMRKAWEAGAGAGAVVNGIFGAALVVIGIGIVRRRRWAHPALTACCWASIAVLAILAKPTLAPFFVLAGDQSGGSGPLLLVAALILMIAQIVAVLWFLRFWRRPEVREFFGPSVTPGGR